MLEESFAMSRALARPIAMFVDQSDESAIAEAVDAGISAYVVDGLRKERIKPVLELAVRRFQAFARLQSELTEARSELAERKTIDRAKAHLHEAPRDQQPAACTLLRKQAMDSSRRVADIAEVPLPKPCWEDNRDALPDRLRPPRRRGVANHGAGLWAGGTRGGVDGL